MQIIQPTVEILDTNGYDINGIYRDIERAARTCYKSEANITEDSAARMVKRLIDSGHLAMLEHGTVYLKVPKGKNFRDEGFIFVNGVYTSNLYYRKVVDSEGNWYITTNYRYIIENKLEHWLIYLCEPTEYHEKRYAVRFITSIGIGREILRHRIMSFANESTRYCNYSKKSFNREITFIEPSWTHESNRLYIDFVLDCENAEHRYMSLLDNGCTPQQAREVLPLSTKSELIVTGFASDWKYFLNLRSSTAITGKPHPDMVILADRLKEKLTEL